MMIYEIHPTTSSKDDDELHFQDILFENIVT